VVIEERVNSQYFLVTSLGAYVVIVTWEVFLFVYFIKTIMLAEVEWML